ncbi:hypothetical protein DOS84_01630 [Flavobacterium aquariorum]|uniref:Uncharacterized protein n=1 Tax=Flavobacterium aquariorum TaxID=2217670 RepID=A0A2W7TZ20_9FLAO|nr:hypothetical protein [Flavobacterium aquariorum]PZX95288.1 hypothetical protein DOS84_01630 [Flavobacterium aquariorum]
MSVQKENNPENPEIDLLTVFSRIGDFFEWINTSLFRIIRFFVKNAIVVAVLIVIGIGIGKYLDSAQKTYVNKITVTPNFKSTDYLYAKIDFLASKIKLQDTVFLKSIGIQNPLQIASISVAPILNVNDLVNKEDKEFQLLQLMKENESLNTIVKDTTLRKYYNFHSIKINANGIIVQKNTIDPILNFLNTSVYYEAFKKINSQNIQNNIKEKEATILQIDRILNKFSSANTSQSGNEKLIYYNENLNLDKIIKTKDSLCGEIDKLKIEQYNTGKTIREQGMVLNIKSNKIFKWKLIFILPLVFVGLFVFFSFFISFYKKQSLKANANLK